MVGRPIRPEETTPLNKNKFSCHFGAPSQNMLNAPPGWDGKENNSLRLVAVNEQSEPGVPKQVQLQNTTPSHKTHLTSVLKIFTYN
jgi:hypothetical protein